MERKQFIAVCAKNVPVSDSVRLHFVHFKASDALHVYFIAITLKWKNTRNIQTQKRVETMRSTWRCCFSIHHFCSCVFGGGIENEKKPLLHSISFLRRAGASVYDTDIRAFSSENECLMNVCVVLHSYHIRGRLPPSAHSHLFSVSASFCNSHFPSASQWMN